MGAYQSTEGMHVVIVGGGYGGSLVATKLIKEKLCKVTLVDGRDGMFHDMGAVRTSVDEKYEDKLFVPYDQMIGDSFKRGKVVQLLSDKNTLVLESGEQITYTHLVLASGASAPFPGKLPIEITAREGKNMYREFRRELSLSNNVVIVGADFVGVELAGEIKHDFPAKKVTLISSTEYLASDKGNENFQKSLVKTVKESGIEVLFNEHVSNLGGLALNKHVGGQTVETEGGKRVEADLVLPCTGTRLNDGFYKDDLAKSIDENGYLRVDEGLKVEHQDNIWAIGCINNVEEVLVGYLAKYQPHVVARNLMSAGYDCRGLAKKYKPDDTTMIVTVGRNGGTGQFSCMVIGNMLTRHLKSRDQYYQQVWKDLGVKMPTGVCPV